MDAETYLRCRLEDLLISGSRGVDELRNRARAALAVAAIDADTAAQVLSDAARALRLRTRDQDEYFDEDDDADEGTPPRVVARPVTITTEWGTLVLTYVVFGGHETRFGARGEIDPAHRTPRGFHPHDVWTTLTVVDAAGQSHDAHYSGGSSDDSFDGEFGLHPALPRETTSLTIAGRTIDLTSVAPACTVRVDALDGLSPAERATRYLGLVDDRSSRFGVHYGDDSDAAELARQTFTALGVDVSPDPSGPGPGRSNARPARAPRRRSRHRNVPQRWIGIGATTEEVDGLVLTVLALADDGTLSYRGRSVTGLSGGQHLLRPTATDDRGNEYHFEPSGSSGGGRAFDVRGRLVPDPDPAARLLTLAFDTPSARIEINVPLEWQEDEG